MAVRRIAGSLGDLNPTFTVFKPAELFKLTGMTPALQRVWKRRGQLPWNDQEASEVTAWEAAEIFVRHQFAAVGVPPSESQTISSNLAPVVLWHALLNTDSACEVVGPPEEVETFIERFRAGHQLASQITGVTSDKAFRYIYKFTGLEDFLFSQELGNVIAGSDFASLISLNLEYMGTLLGARAGRSLITIELLGDGIPGSKWTRRLTRG